MRRFRDTRDQSSPPEWTSEYESVFYATHVSHIAFIAQVYIYFEKETHLCPRDTPLETRSKITAMKNIFLSNFSLSRFFFPYIDTNYLY